jgi:hypothetical protein
MRLISMKRVGLFIAVLFALACGGGGGGAGLPIGGNNGVVLNLNSAQLGFGQTLNLTATVPGQASQTVTWTANRGTITPTGPSTAVYTAPATGGTFTITARSAASPSLFATAVVTVSQVGVTIDPTATTLGPGKSTIFTGRVSGSANATVNFTATGGTIVRINATQVTYTAPSTTGSYTVTASAAADPSKRATASVTVANLGSNATVTGSVRLDGSVTGVPNVIIAFYSAAGAELGRVTTGADGRFNATIPASARRFHVISSSLLPAYHAQFTYANLRYAASIATCSAPLPTLTAGSTIALPSSIFVNQSTEPPPPPPNGCSL